ncbi:fluoride efflux transporter CrcB [Endozoicomonas sp. Mp262]|uniref:fluoride efflux transporter CrcB n=1 Tax=Endozoicomonas sp. Mp262 TaxID=2919499 RepID=UPI0021D7E469
MINYLAVAMGGALGALLRSFIYGRFAVSGNSHLYPLPTLTVNVLGSVLIGIGWYCLVEKAMLPPVWKNLAITGFLGALTTFSTFSLDSFRLIQSNHLPEAVVYIVISVIICLVGTWAGYQGVRWLL